MKDDIPIKNGIVIPGHELEIATTRAGGPGGQHANKTSTRVIVRWNVLRTQALNDEQKKRVLTTLHAELTKDGDLIVTSSASRSQLQNKKAAFKQLATKLRKALHVTKKRMKTRIPKSVKESRLQEKKLRGAIKKIRKKVDYND